MAQEAKEAETGSVTKIQMPGGECHMHSFLWGRHATTAVHVCKSSFVQKCNFIV
jgi:hypothetical protein